MPFALIVGGIFLLVAGIRNTQNDLFALVAKDFTGPNNYLYWLVAIAVIGSIGYIKPLRSASTAFLVLLIVVLLLVRGNPKAIGGGIFQQLTTGLKATTGSTSTAQAGSLTA